MARTRGPREAAHSVAGQQEGDGPRVWRLEPRLKNGATAAIYAVRPRAARKVAEPQLGGACAPARAALAGEWLCLRALRQARGTVGDAAKEDILSSVEVECADGARRAPYGDGQRRHVRAEADAADGKVCATCERAHARRHSGDARQDLSIEDSRSGDVDLVVTRGGGASCGQVGWWDLAGGSGRLRQIAVHPPAAAFRGKRSLCGQRRPPGSR